MTREQLIKALRGEATLDAWAMPKALNQMLIAAADMLEADGVPVAWIDMDDGMIVSSPRSFSDGSHGEVPLYMAPQPDTQERMPLTDEQIDALALDEDGLQNSQLEFARAIEAAHGITENKP